MKLKKLNEVNANFLPWAWLQLDIEGLVYRSTRQRLLKIEPVSIGRTLYLGLMLEANHNSIYYDNIGKR